MKYRPFASVSLILLSFVVTVMISILDTSIYGINGHPTQWLSFLPHDPLRHMGLSLFISPFLHINLMHALFNMIFFIPLALMIERKKSGKFLAFSFFLHHALVLLSLVIVDLFFSLEGKAFLGSSHVITGLYIFWALYNKNYALLFWPLLIIGIGLREPQPLILLAHSLGLLVGVIVFYVIRLWDKFRT